MNINTDDYPDGWVSWAPVPLHQSQPCPYVVLKSPKVKQLKGYVSLEADLSSVLACFEQLACQPQQALDALTCQALTTHAVVTYLKCFTRSTLRPKLEEKGLLRAQPDLRRRHRQLKTMRHEFYAHAGESLHETSHVLATLSPDAQQPGVIGLEIAGHRLRSLEGANCTPFITLVSFVLAHVRERKTALLQCIEAQMRSTAPEQLYQQACYPAGLEPERFIQNT